MRCYCLQGKNSVYSTFFPLIISLNFAMAAPQCFSSRPRLKFKEEMFLCSALLSPGLPVETRQHDNKEGCDVEEEEAGEEGAEPGK